MYVLAVEACLNNSVYAASNTAQTKVHCSTKCVHARNVDLTIECIKLDTCEASSTNHSGAHVILVCCVTN